MGKSLQFQFTRSKPTMHLLFIAILGLSAWLISLPICQQHWAHLTSTYSIWTLLILGPWLIHQIVFWSISLAYHYVDVHDKPAFIARHRIQHGKHKRPSMTRTLKVLAWNQLLWAPLMLTLMAGLLYLRGWTASPEFPSFLQLSTELLLLGGSSAVIFYATHRFLHRPWWMKRVHQVHHEYRSTIAMASEYAHPVEFCIGNFGTLAGGVVLFAPSLAAIYLFTILALLTILVHHGGYALSWAPWALPHDWHHYRYKELFGTSGFLDRVFGTDAEFKTLEQDEFR